MNKANQKSQEIDKCRGVRQESILSPILLNPNSEEDISIENVKTGVIINGHHINNLSYIDDEVIIATSMGDLKEI